MIPWTEAQIQALQNAQKVPVGVVNPRTGETFVLQSDLECEGLRDCPYDDSPWTRDELEILAWEAGLGWGWEDMDEYDQLPNNPP